jgi:mannose-6-phosphate isomerase-like protein (cupin superfamily)
MTDHERGFNPGERYLFLADGGGQFPIDDISRFWDELMGDGELSADMNHWEMHPEGNEVLFVLSGGMDLVLDELAGERTVRLDPEQAGVVPQGIWHRQIVRAATSPSPTASALSTGLTSPEVNRYAKQDR